ncbi:hypothetical protein [Thalassospira profundimaris]|uniref:hypothetical protein n=1 Tax=Thalassospira profundimaris TaxID=502049 RepID=UPI0011BFD43A|nr:hypothetical protein [Thalassospira profundimaris]
MSAGEITFGVNALANVVINSNVTEANDNNNKNNGPANEQNLTAAEKAALDGALTDPASLAQVVQQILQDRQETTNGLTPYIAGLVTKYAIGRNTNAAATITSTAIAVAMGDSVEVKLEKDLVVVAVATATAPDKAGEITAEAAKQMPDFLAEITQAAVTVVPDRAADITAAAVRANPSQAANVAKAAAAAAPQQARAITTAAAAQAPGQASSIVSEVSLVVVLNGGASQDVIDGVNNITQDTTNDGFDDVEPVDTSAAQENPASADKPKT